MASQLTLCVSNVYERPDTPPFATWQILDATNHTTTAITATGATDYADVRFRDHVAIQIVNGATNNVIFNVEVSTDASVWMTTATRATAAAAYAATAVTIAGGASGYLYISPDDNVGFVRINVGTANANGTTFKVFAH